MNTLPPPGLRPVQIVVGMLTLGAVGASLVFAVIPSNRAALDPFVQRILLGAAAAILVLGQAMAVLAIGPQVRAQVRRTLSADERDAPTACLPPFVTLSILRAAAAEGPALLAAVTVFLTGEYTGLAIVAAAVIVLAAGFPTRAKFESFVEAVTANRQP